MSRVYDASTSLRLVLTFHLSSVCYTLQYIITAAWLRYVVLSPSLAAGIRIRLSHVIKFPIYSLALAKKTGPVRDPATRRFIQRDSQPPSDSGPTSISPLLPPISSGFMCTPGAADSTSPPLATGLAPELEEGILLLIQKAFAQQQESLPLAPAQPSAPSDSSTFVEVEAATITFIISHKFRASDHPSINPPSILHWVVHLGGRVELKTINAYLTHNHPLSSGRGTAETIQQCQPSAAIKLESLPSLVPKLHCNHSSHIQHIRQALQTAGFEQSAFSGHSFCRELLHQPSPPDSQSMRFDS
ncbi:hypothetical protein J3R30DRAFT_3714016 [Lentinula aciculospora]|uniref:Uncharacterized protein n=1 Tax=Lentinula aciculospora TaxID=153920 RepID=A0A9W8ZY48_9AGAR|nr:hypothetical protein J3R30DRAFT_3714016 [Lentinula aciculospora]